MKNLLIGFILFVVGVYALFFICFACSFLLIGLESFFSAGGMPNPSSISDCSGKWFFSDRNGCFLELAHKMKDSSLCAEMSPIESQSFRQDVRTGEKKYMIGRTYCYFLLARETRNPALCSRIIGDRQQEICTAELARILSDSKLCSGMRYGDVKSWCQDAAQNKMTRERPQLFLD